MASPLTAVTRAGRSLLIAGAMLLAVAAASPVPAAETQPVNERQLKAAFLFNFAKFVTWPPSDRPLAICVAGDDALSAAASELLRGRLVEGRPVDARPLAVSATPEGCDLLYLGGLKPDDASAILARTQGPVLTVGETPRFLRDGGMVRIYLDANRMRFQVNRNRTEAAGLRISSQLLVLAQ